MSGKKKRPDRKPSSRDRLLAGLDDGVVVRMYRPGGLGDCFLLAFPPREDPTFLLIDCGVFNGTRGGAARMKAIARDIQEVTKTHLHALVATHEHWDHLSGFRWAKEVFDDLPVDEVWVAWTEDPTDKLANELRGKRRRTAKALAASVARLEQEGLDQAAEVGEVLGFSLGLKDDGTPDLLAAGSESPGTAKQMEYVRKQWGTPRYLRPGSELPWAGDFRVYVLGPPEDRDLLGRSDPSSVDSEVYEDGRTMNEANTFGLAVLRAAGEKLNEGEEELFARSQPFESHLGLSLETLEEDEDSPWGDFFRRRYGFSRRKEKGHGPKWRRIAGAWLSAAGRLALQLDSDTNNTSLALAIEHRPTGKVLLFPADAQVGNWLSWHGHRWPRSPGGEATAGADEENPITAEELLGRTVVYKVGHHGSHNATLREQGLEKMSHPELVALLPVDKDQAKKKRWEMPFGPLYERLLERCGERVLRADTGLPRRPANVPRKDWQRFSSRTDEDDLWVQYSVPLTPSPAGSVPTGPPATAKDEKAESGKAKGEAG